MGFITTRSPCFNNLFVSKVIRNVVFERWGMIILVSLGHLFVGGFTHRWLKLTTQPRYPSSVIQKTLHHIFNRTTSLELSVVDLAAGTGKWTSTPLGELLFFRVPISSRFVWFGLVQHWGEGGVSVRIVWQARCPTVKSCGCTLR